MPVRRLGAGHDSGETEYRISNFGYPVSCAHAHAQTATTEFARALLVSIRNKIVEFVENLILFTLKSIEKDLFSFAKSYRLNIYAVYIN
jgi:hypothetical protein